MVLNIIFYSKIGKHILKKYLKQIGAGNNPVEFEDEIFVDSYESKAHLFTLGELLFIDHTFKIVKEAILTDPLVLNMHV